MSEISIFSLNIKSWTGQRVIPLSEIRVNGSQAKSKLMSSGSKYLIDPKNFTVLKAIRNKAMGLLSNNGVHINGSTYAVPMSSARMVINELNKLKLDYENQANNLCSNLQNLHQTWKKENDKNNNYNLSLSNVDIKSKFGFEILSYKMASTGVKALDATTQNLEDSMPEKCAKEVAKQANAYLNKAPKNLTKKVLRLLVTWENKLAGFYLMSKDIKNVARDMRERIINMQNYTSVNFKSTKAQNECKNLIKKVASMSNGINKYHNEAKVKAKASPKKESPKKPKAIKVSPKVMEKKPAQTAGMFF